MRPFSIGIIGILLLALGVGLYLSPLREDTPRVAAFFKSVLAHSPAQAALGALAWSGEGYEWYYEPEYYVPAYEPYEYDEMYWVSDTGIEYWDSYDYVEPYQDMVVYYEEPWYERAFPGIGDTITYILPPVLQPQPSYAPIAPTPSCSLSAQPSRLPFGGATTLHWSSEHATRATLSGEGPVHTRGSRVENGLTLSRTYTLSVSGAGGSALCETYVEVVPTHARPLCIISAHPSFISRGERASIAWGSENAFSAYLPGVGPVGLQGGLMLSPASSQTYTLTVYDPSGLSASCSTELTVR